MGGTNPFLLNKKPPSHTKEPIILKVPMYEFSSVHEMEEEILPEELCVAKVPNTGKTGFMFHIGFAYKDKGNNVYSLPLTQHHGSLLNTPENEEFIRGLEESQKDPAE